MFPYFTLFGRQIPLYGTLTVLGALLALLYLKMRTRRLPPKEEADIQLALLFSALGAVAGAKILWLATVWQDFVSELPLLFQEPLPFAHKYLSGGFVFYGGLYGALAGLVLYRRAARGAELDRYLNLLFPCFPLIHAFGRLGCFCMGCCYGRETASAIGVTFHVSEIAPNGVPLIPVQIMEAGAGLLLFFLCASLAARQVPGKRILGLYLVSYGLLRFVLEFFRGDGYRGFIGPLAVSQWISIPTVLLGVWLLWRVSRTRGRDTNESEGSADSRR